MRSLDAQQGFTYALLAEPGQVCWNCRADTDPETWIVRGRGFLSPDWECRRFHNYWRTLCKESLGKPESIGCYGTGLPLAPTSRTFPSLTRTILLELLKITTPLPCFIWFVR